MLAVLEERGLTVDEVALVDGPFIPDGTVRIYAEGSPYDVLGSGTTLEEAFAELELACRCCP